MYKKILEDMKKYDEELNTINETHKKAVDWAKQYADPKSKIEEADAVKKNAIKELHDKYKNNSTAYYEDLNKQLNKVMAQAPNQEALNGLLLLKARNNVSQEELNAYASLSKNYGCFNLLNEIAEANGLEIFYKDISNIRALNENASDIMKMTNDFYETRGQNESGYEYTNAVLLNGSMLETYENNYNNFINAFTDETTTNE